MKKSLVVMPKSKFIRVICKKCGNEQVIYSKIASEVNCVKCNEVIAVSRGGNAEIRAKIQEIFG
jgi:small subunit ribosomal protein S27e